MTWKHRYQHILKIQTTPVLRIMLLYVCLYQQRTNGRSLRRTKPPSITWLFPSAQTFYLFQLIVLVLYSPTLLSVIAGHCGQLLIKLRQEDKVRNFLLELKRLDSFLRRWWRPKQSSNWSKSRTIFDNVPGKNNPNENAGVANKNTSEY